MFIFLFNLFISLALAQNTGDLNSYCFNKSVSLSEVHQSLKLLLLPRDIVEYRTEDNCLDIVASPDRGKLFEKYLSKRYPLISESSSGRDQECRLDLKTTKKKKIDTSNFKIGEKNVLNAGESTTSSLTNMEFLLGAGIPGEINLWNEQFKVLCRLIGSESANLTFSFLEKDKGSFNSELVVKKGQWVNVASVINELKGQTKTIGIPQTEISQSNEKNETVYELQLK